MDQNNQITIDVIIAKFVPIIGAVLFVMGLGYLIYTSVWQDMDAAMRLGVGFFVSIMIIGSAFSFSEKLRYFADVVMGGGILLLYGTLIYGSRTTDMAQAIIPEIATLVSAFIFTLGVSYFASLRKSKVILALSILGAYLTPFVIGQNDVWSSSISFNGYLTYFAMVNVVIFIMGREIATHDLIPLNLLGLFFGTYTLHSLVYEGSTQFGDNFFQGSDFTIVLLTLLVAMSIMGIALSSKNFSSKEETYLSVGYLLPFLWFSFHVEALHDVSQSFQIACGIIIAAVYFFAWYFLRPLENSRYQHVATYVGGLIALISVLNTIFPEFNVYSSILIAYIGLIFAGIYIFDGTKVERILAAFLFSLFGAILCFSHISQSSDLFSPTLLKILALIPAALLAIAVRIQGKTHPTLVKFIEVYSVFSCVLIFLVLIIKVLKAVDFGFMFFIFPGFLAVLYSYFQENKNPTRATLMRIGTVWMSLGFLGSFLFLIENLAPHAADNEHFWIEGGIFANWYIIKALFALVTYFLALGVSRQIQLQEKVDRPSFLLVIIAYTTLLLVINFSIITFCNDLGIALTIGGVRAIATTFWWIILSLGMLMVGIRGGHIYRSEKLLGLLLLLLTIGKIALYDLAAMDMNKKIIVLMLAGGGIMVFSYFLQVKGYLKDEKIQ